MAIRDFTEGDEIDTVLLVRDVEVRQRRDGGDFLRITFGDRTGSVPGQVWENVGEVTQLVRVGEPLRVRARYSVHPRYGPQLSVRALRAPVPGSYRLEELIDGPQRDAEQMEADLRELLATIQNVHLRELLARLFDPGADVWRAYRSAPAAKHYHQAYRHGLLEHSLGVAQAVSAISATFGGIDRDVAVTGALLHDLGKLAAYTPSSPAIELTDEGRLQGEIALGYYHVRREIERLDGFPHELAQAVLHIILSHHGTLEHGSPVIPCTREATLVHMIDNLGGRLGSFDRLEKGLAAGQSWSSFDRAIGGSAFFGGREDQQAAEREAA